MPLHSPPWESRPDVHDPTWPSRERRPERHHPEGDLRRVGRTSAARLSRFRHRRANARRHRLRTPRPRPPSPDTTHVDAHHLVPIPRGRGRHSPDGGQCARAVRRAPGRRAWADGPGGRHRSRGGPTGGDVRVTSATPIRRPRGRRSGGRRGGVGSGWAGADRRAGAMRRAARGRGGWAPMRQHGIRCGGARAVARSLSQDRERSPRAPPVPTGRGWGVSRQAAGATGLIDNRRSGEGRTSSTSRSTRAARRDPWSVVGRRRGRPCGRTRDSHRPGAPRRRAGGGPRSPRGRAPSGPVAQMVEHHTPLVDRLVRRRLAHRRAVGEGYRLHRGGRGFESRRVPLRSPPRAPPTAHGASRRHPRGRRAHRAADAATRTGA